MYGNSAHYLDQITNGYSQMNLGLPQVSSSLGYIANQETAEYPPYSGVMQQQTPQYDPVSEMYFQPSLNLQPLQYHLYASSAPRRHDLASNQRTAADFFIPDDLRETLQRQNEAAQRVFMETSLPKNIKGYHSLVPLDISGDTQGSIRRFGYPSWVYKADSSKFGKKYALRRLENYKLTNEDSIANVQKWRRVKSSCVVAFHEAFTTKAFEDDSIIFVYDYHPDSKSLAEIHFANETPYGRQHRSSHNYHHHNATVIPEKVLWGYIVQIATGLKAIHSQNLACRVLDLSTLLVSSDRRVRLNCCGIMDVIAPMGDGRLLGEQLLDLSNFGRYMLSLAVNSQEAFQDPGRWIETAKRRYPGNLGGALSYLINFEENTTRNITEFLANISDVLTNYVDSSLHYNDYLETHLSRELENGRLVRLLIKLGFINERPEFDHNPQWHETGDRFLLKLFRDYVFHRVNEMGEPVVDLAYVLSCLNKLDAGTEERITLVSRDEQACFIVTYKEVRSLLLNTMLKLCS